MRAFDGAARAWGWPGSSRPAGAALRVRHRTVDLAGELFDLDRREARAARLVLSATW